jgi:uncharacterized protein YjdB
MKKVFYLSGLLALCFSVFSLNANATPIPVAVHITTSPANDTVCSGTSAMFMIAALDTNGGVTTTVNYAWQVSTDGGTTWTSATDTTMYSGDSSSMLTVSAHLSMNGYKYRCIAYDSNGTATSSAAILTVIGIAPGTIAGPSFVCRSGSITLTDSISGGTWSSVSPSIATISGGVLTGHSFGYDTVKYTDSNMCGMGVASFVVRVDTPVSARAISGPTATCVGHDITLTNPNVLGTWTWSTSNGHASVSHAGIVTGVSHGTDTVYYAFSNGCSSVSSAYVITIDTPLSAGSISGSDSLCAGSWTHLFETVGGGSWFSSNSAIAVVDASGNVTGVDQGTVTISYYLANACGASVATHVMHLTRTASMIAGIDSVGVGHTRTLLDSVSGGMWTSDDTTIARIDATSGVVTGMAVGATTISYTVTNFCGTSYATVMLYVGNPSDPGIIAGTASVCIGSTVSLSDAVSGGVWSSSNDSIATVSSSGVVTGVAVDSGTASTNVIITYTVSNGFGDSSATKAITVLHTPIVSISEYPATYMLGTNYLIKGTPAGGTWTHSAGSSVATIMLVYDSVVSGVDYGTFISYIMTAPGTDVLHYKVTNICGTADSTITAVISTVNGINNVNSGSVAFNVYPNPNHGEFVMAISSPVKEEAIVAVTNVVGEKVKEVTVSTNEVANLELDVPAGVYVLTATTSTGKYTKRVSITK